MRHATKAVAVTKLQFILLCLASLFLTPSAHAKYRYDSVGNLLAKSGPLAEANLIRFSGKEYHPRSGLYYYGFRYYQPNLQRWLNQDPIGLAGGLNLYGFVGNDPIGLADEDGRIFGEAAAGFGNLMGDASERSCSPAADAALSLMSDLAHMAAGLDPNYAVKEGLKQDVNTLMNEGVGAYVAQKHAQIEDAVGTSDIVKAVDYGDEYNAAEQVVYGLSGAGKTFLTVLGAKGLTSPKPTGATADPASGFPKATPEPPTLPESCPVAAKTAATPTRFINGVKVTDRATGNVLEGTVDLKPTLDRISSGQPFPHRNDGGIFQNRPLPGRTTPELPAQSPGYYREYVHPTPGVSGPGPQRIVVGQGGEMYYTPNHYDTFIPINPR